MKKPRGDIIILHMCIINYDQMMHGSWDMVQDRRMDRRADGQKKWQTEMRASPKKDIKDNRTIIEKDVSQLLKTGDLQESYNKWVATIETSIVQRRWTKNPRKDIKELQKIHKRLREECLTAIELLEKILILERIKILKECITEKYIEGRIKRINHVAQEIRENVDNGGKIWNSRENLKRKFRHHIWKK